MKKAFTTIEMVIVLGIVALLLAFTMPNFTHSRQLMMEEQFWRSMRQQWRTAQIAAQLHHQATNVDYDKEAQQITFSTGRHHTEVVVPGTLTVRRFNAIEMHEDGYVRPQTMVFDSRLNDCRYLMKIQLAWGGYRLEKVAK